MTRKKEAALLLFTFLGSIALDQWFKFWIRARIPLNAAAAEELPLIPGLVRLTHIHNYGAAFGMLEGGRWLFLGLLALFCALVLWAIRSRWLPTPFSRFLAVLATGGAIGNGIDRFFHGYVVDMFELEFMRFAVFNIADAFLCVSAALFVVWTMLYKEEKPNESDTSL